ncbi:MAG: DUF6804 family protein [Candidatus Moraniibacteriota bacterium]
MFYEHKYFTIDTKRKIVFDENRKELRLTGNAYRVLVFLCTNKCANLTEVGDFLDMAKDYDENHLRQYRYKINTIVGKTVIEYKNKVYSLVGEVEGSDKLTKKQRNTDLLQSSSVNSIQTNIINKKEMKLTRMPAIIASIMLLLTFLDWPSGYYTLLRIAVTGISVYYAFYTYSVQKKLDVWFWILVAIAVLFNPIFPIYLYDKSIWWIIDIATAVLLISMAYFFNNLDKKKIEENKLV